MARGHAWFPVAKIIAYCLLLYSHTYLSSLEIYRFCGFLGEKGIQYSSVAMQKKIWSWKSAYCLFNESNPDRDVLMVWYADSRSYKASLLAYLGWYDPNTTRLSSVLKTWSLFFCFCVNIKTLECDNPTESLLNSTLLWYCCLCSIMWFYFWVYEWNSNVWMKAVERYSLVVILVLQYFNSKWNLVLEWKRSNAP